MHWSSRSDFGPKDERLAALRARALASPPDPALGPDRRHHTDAIDLTATNPTTVGLELPDWTPLLARECLYLAEPLGRLAARSALAASYRNRWSAVTASDLCLLSSTSEGYLWLMQLLCDPGDAVLVPSPSYPLLEHLAQLAGVRLRPYPLRYAGGWDLDGACLPDTAEIESQRIRAVIAVSPNNPTGSFLSQPELERLAQLGLPLIVDEVFRFCTLSPNPPSEPLALPGLTFLLDGLSKRAAAPGLKLGWVLAKGPPEVAGAAMERLSHFADALLTTSAPVQQALPEILAGEDLAQARVLERLRTNRGQALDITRGSPVSLLAVDAGYQLIVQLPAVCSELDFLTQLADMRIWAHPGGLYGLPLSPALVISLLPEPKRFEDAMRRIVSLTQRAAQGAASESHP